MKKEPLYRKENTKARGHNHLTGPRYAYTRNNKHNDNVKMKQGVERGLDYTPLFKFLLSRVGKDWEGVCKEARSRLDKPEPIFWMVSESKIDGDEEMFRFGNAFFNRLYVDENNILQKINPDLSVNDVTPFCKCCTHTFNGKVVTNISITG